MATPICCEELSISVSDGFVRVLVICINTPNSTHNIVDRTFGLEFSKAVVFATEQANKNAIDLVVVCSGKSNGFIAGADINTMLSCIGNAGALRIFVDTYRLNCMYCALEILPVPTITIINGTVLGAGLELAMSCDYRVIKDGIGQQIGLPEVKIGVLPGAGGCFRMPYLIGLRKSLPLLVSGSSISSKQALRLGLVDATWAETQSVKEDGSTGCYSYEWIKELMQCIESGHIGKKAFKLNYPRSTAVPPDRIVINLPNLTEEELMQTQNISWSSCDAKALKKFRYRPAVNSTLSSPLHFIIDFITYAICVIQLRRRIGETMPAPYSALLCAWRCYNVSNIQEGVAESSSRFAHLVETAESKCLMSLFLLQRRLKKLSPETPPTDVTRVIVITDATGDYSTAFIQSLLYNNITTVGVLLTGEWNALVANVEKLFQYSLTRGHMTKKGVQEKMKLLYQQTSGPVDDGLMIINTCSRVVSNVQVGYNILPSNNEGVELHLGDPLRKNTLSIEIMNDDQQKDKVAAAASLVSKMGKTPVITPNNSNIGWRLVLAHWSLAVKVAMTMGVEMDYIEKVLKNGGFTGSPFAQMRKFGKDPMLTTVISQLNGDQLLTEFTNSKFHKTTPTPEPHPQTLLFIFIANVVVTALDLLTQYSNTVLSADAIDFICVSGLIGFPPTEGGPVNYLKRNGCGSLMADKLRNIVTTNQHLKEYAISLSIALDDKIIDGCGLSLLSDNELANIGPSRGSPHVSSLLYPIPINARSLIVYAILLIIILLLYYYIIILFL